MKRNELELEPLQTSLPKPQVGGQINLVADGFIFPEGPVLDEGGQVYVCDVRGNTIYKVHPGRKEKKAWLKFDGQANGATWSLDRKNLLVADSGKRRILSIGPDATYQVILSGKFNGPNDITVDSQGVIYFTDPTWEEGHEQIPQYVFALFPSGELRKYGPFNQPNGIKFRSGRLFLAEGGTGKIFVTTPPEMHFQLWATVQDRDYRNSKALDGLEVDAQGRVFVAAYDWGLISVFDKSGKSIGQIDLPDAFPTNLEFDAEEKRLFITEAKHGRLFCVTPAILPSGEKRFTTSTRRL